MSEDADWGPWVEHDGIDLPVPNGVYLQARQANGHVVEGIADHSEFTDGDCNMWCWADCDRFGFWNDRAISYRIRKPRALRELIDLAASPCVPPPVIGPEGPVRDPAGVPA